jgi:Protein of unknown function (DUF2934)
MTTQSEETSVAPASLGARERIEARAHELYRARGGEEGHDLDDWLRAEAELRGQNED